MQQCTINWYLLFHYLCRRCGTGTVRIESTLIGTNQLMKGFHIHKYRHATVSRQKAFFQDKSLRFLTKGSGSIESPTRSGSIPVRNVDSYALVGTHQCCGSGTFIRDPNFFHPVSRIHIQECKYSILTQKMVSKFSEI
jgi:hypothetical protein